MSPLTNQLFGLAKDTKPPLGFGQVGFTFLATDTGQWSVWSGTDWLPYVAPTPTGVVDLRPAIAAGASHAAITCTDAATDYHPAGGIVPAGTTHIVVEADHPFVIGNEATSGTAGIALSASTEYIFRVNPGDQLHVQAPADAGTVVSISYLK